MENNRFFNRTNKLSMASGVILFISAIIGFVGDLINKSYNETIEVSTLGIIIGTAFFVALSIGILIRKKVIQCVSLVLIVIYRIIINVNTDLSSNLLGIIINTTPFLLLLLLLVFLILNVRNKAIKIVSYIGIITNTLISLYWVMTSASAFYLYSNPKDVVLVIYLFYSLLLFVFMFLYTFSIFREINPKRQSTNKNVKNQENQIDKVEQIKYYKELLDNNLITKEEFEQKKKEIL